MDILRDAGVFNFQGHEVDFFLVAFIQAPKEALPQYSIPPLWYSGQISWLQIRGPDSITGATRFSK
jgi:hypothetical protein